MFAIELYRARHPLRRCVFRRREDDRYLLPAGLHGENAGPRSLPVLRQCRPGRASRLSALFALPSGTRAGSCARRQHPHDCPGRGGAHRSRRAQRRRQPGRPGREFGTQLAPTAPLGAQGTWRVARRARENESFVAGQTLDRRNATSHGAGRVRGRVRKRAAVQRTISQPLSALAQHAPALAVPGGR